MLGLRKQEPIVTGQKKIRALISKVIIVYLFQSSHQIVDTSRYVVMFLRSSVLANNDNLYIGLTAV